MYSQTDIIFYSFRSWTSLTASQPNPNLDSFNPSLNPSYGFVSLNPKGSETADRKAKIG